MDELIEKFSKMKNYANKYPRDFFRSNKNVLIWSGMWWNPYNSPKKISIFYKFYSIWLYFFCILGWLIGSGSYLGRARENIFCFIKSLNCNSTQFTTLVEYFIWYRKKKTLIRIMKTLEDPVYHYESIGDFKPGQIFAKAKFITTVMTYSFLFLSEMVSLTTVLPMFILFFIDPHYHELEPYEPGTKTIFGDKLSYSCWWPVDLSYSRLAFFGALVLESVPLYGISLVLTSIVTLFASTVNCCTAHFEVLQGAFTTIRERSMIVVEKLQGEFGFYDDSYLEKEIERQFKKCIVHHQVIVEIVREIESIFTYLILQLALTTIMVHCTCMYMVQSVPLADAMFIGQVVYLMAVTFNFFLFTWFGNELSLKSNGISDAIYNSDWFSGSPQYKRLIIIAMIRTVKCVELTCGKFAPVNLDTLVWILRASYSYLAVLQNMS